MALRGTFSVAPAVPAQPAILPKFPNNTAALAGGLAVGALYINMAGVQQVQPAGS